MSRWLLVIWLVVGCKDAQREHDTREAQERVARLRTEVVELSLQVQAALVTRPPAPASSKAALEKLHEEQAALEAAMAGSKGVRLSH
jgi:hypothetical protein